MMLRLSWLISIAISFFGVMIIEHFFAMSPDDTSNGGNLGAFGLALVVPFICLSLFITYRYFETISRNMHNGALRIGILLIGILAVSICYHYAIDFKDDVYTKLGGNRHDPNSMIFGYPLINSYTNHVFINLYTYVFVHGIIALLAWLIGMFKQPQPIDQKEEPYYDELS